MKRILSILLIGALVSCSGGQVEPVTADGTDSTSVTTAASDTASSVLDSTDVQAADSVATSDSLI